MRMEKDTENINKNVVIHLTDDGVEDFELKSKLKSLDARVQRILLWSTIGSLWSYSMLFIVVARIYSGYNGTHGLMLAICMIFIYLLMGVLICWIWKGTNYKRSYYYFTRKSHLNYQFSKLSDQRKFIIIYMVIYTLLLAIASLFFLTNVQQGLTFVLKITIPVNIITYASGLYFIANFTKHIKQLEYSHQQINQLYLKGLNSN
jgi:hypothetical protein